MSEVFGVTPWVDGAVSTGPLSELEQDRLDVAARRGDIVTAQTNPLTGGVAVSVGGVTTPTPSLYTNGVVKASGVSKLRNIGANHFRSQGGIVAAYYYGEWRQIGMSYNTFPWKWFKGFQDRLPLPSIPLPSTPEYTFSTDSGLIGWTVSGGTLTVNADNIRLTATGSDPIYYSPSNLDLIGSENLSVEVKVKKIAGATWDGKLYFITNEDASWSAGKSLTLTEPTWDGSAKTLTFSMSGNASWTQGTVKQIRIDLGADSTSIYELYSVKIIQSGRSLKESNEVYGLPSDKQWAVDWEIKTAYDHGIDVFVHNYYWNTVAGLGVNSNHQKYSLDLHAASTVRPMKFAIQWSNHDAVSPFADMAGLNAILDDWYAYFGNSRYWFINGKPVVYIFSVDKLRSWMSTLFAVSNQEAGVAFVQYANNYMASKTGSVCPDGVFFVGESNIDHPFWWGRDLNAKAWIEYSGFSAGTRYNTFGAYTDQAPTYNYSTGVAAGSASTIYPAVLRSYEQLREVHRKSHDWSLNSSGSGIPCFGTAMSGWDKRPWQGYNSPTFAESWNCIASPADFSEHLVDVRDVVLNAITAGKYQGIPVVNIFAWNEYGEGGFICPTRRYGYGMVEAVLEVFGRA